jgi:hypothetical protein
MKKLFPIILLLTFLIPNAGIAFPPPVTPSGSVSSDTIFDAAGDLVQGTGPNTSARLAIGTPYQVLMVTSGGTAVGWTSTLGATGTRLTKGWFTDLEITNLPTIGGAAITTLLQSYHANLTALSALTPTAGRLLGYPSGSTTLSLIESVLLDDSAAQFYNSSDTTKKVKVDASGMSTTKTATIKPVASDDATFTNNTVGSGTYKFGLLEVAGTWTAKQTFNDIAIPNGATPTVDAAGEMAIDTTSDQLAYYGSAKRVLPYIQYASFVVPAPADTDDINILKAPYGMTILGISCIVQGSTSATGQIQECDSTGGSCADLDSDITCDSDGAADDGSFTDSAIASGGWLRWKTTSVSGTPTFLTVTVRYSVVSD